MYDTYSVFNRFPNSSCYSVFNKQLAGEFIFVDFKWVKLTCKCCVCVLRTDPALRELDPLPKLSLRFCQNNTGCAMYGDHKDFDRSPKQTAIHVLCLKYNFLEFAVDSSWFRTYFKLRTVPVHHTRVICLALCIRLHHLKTLKTLKLLTIYINLWNPHVLRIQVVTYSNWQIQHLYILLTHILNTLQLARNPLQDKDPLQLFDEKSEQVHLEIRTRKFKIYLSTSSW